MFFPVATPKQTREHMKVDGLTNDEVKSHLQVYYQSQSIPLHVSGYHGNFISIHVYVDMQLFLTLKWKKLLILKVHVVSK